VLLRRVVPDGFAMLARPLISVRRRTATTLAGPAAVLSGHAPDGDPLIR
jgi:hypothetical protein